MNRKAWGLLGLAACVMQPGCSYLKQSRHGESPLGFSPGAALASADTTPAGERELCVNTARTVAANGHAKEAILLLEKAEQLAPEQPMDKELAALYAQDGRFDAAVQRYRSMLRNDPSQTDSHNNLAWTLMEAGRLDEASAAIQVGLAVKPSDRRLRSTSAMLAYRQGKRQSAWEQFRGLYGDSAAYHNLAVLDLEQGMLESASQHAALATQYPNCSQESLVLRNTLDQQLAQRLK